MRYYDKEEEEEEEEEEEKKKKQKRKEHKYEKGKKKNNNNMKEKKTGKIKSNKGEREVMELGDFAIKVNSVEGHIGQCLLSNRPSEHDDASSHGTMMFYKLPFTLFQPYFSRSPKHLNVCNNFCS